VSRIDTEHLAQAPGHHISPQIAAAAPGETPGLTVRSASVSAGTVDP
jgi:hypothetical protein